MKENTFGVPSNLSLNIRTYGETYRPLTEKYKPSRRNTVRYLPTRFLHQFGEIPQTTYLRVSYTISEKYRKLPTYASPHRWSSRHLIGAPQNIHPTRILHNPYGDLSHTFFPTASRSYNLSPSKLLDSPHCFSLVPSSLCVPNTADSTVPSP